MYLIFSSACYMQETKQLAADLVRLPQLRELTVQHEHYVDYKLVNGFYKDPDLKFDFINTFLRGIKGIQNLDILELEDIWAYPTLTRCGPIAYFTGVC